MKLIKKATKAEKVGGTIKQRVMQQLKEKHNCEIIYMPYGPEGIGFYTKESI